MGPKVKFTKEQIIDVAFEIAKVEGIDAITIRRIAKNMGSSVAPIYVNFKDIEELKKDVVKKVYGISNELLMEQNSGNPFQDIGLASLKFAKEYSALFRDLVMKKNDYMEDYDDEVGSALIAEMKKDEELADFSDEELMNILFKMRVFQMGLSVMVANGLLPDEFNERKMIEILESTAQDVVIGTRAKKESYNISLEK